MVLALMLFGASNVWAENGTWSNPAGGVWEEAGNWVDGIVPSGPGDIATFPDLGGPVAVEQQALIWDAFGGFIFDSPHSYTIEPAAGNNKQVGDFMAVALQGSHTFNWRLEPAPAANDDLVLDVAEGAELTWANIIYEYPPGQMGVRKEGPGTAILTASGYDWGDERQYRRDVVINGGTLLVNNTEKLGISKDASVQVNDGATLGGIGSMGAPGYPGTVNVYSGGTIAPGDGAGTLTIGNGLTLMDGSNLAFELGTLSDLLMVTGGDFMGSEIGGVTVSIADSGGLMAGNTYDLIDFNGAAPNGVDVDDFQVAAGAYAGSVFGISDGKLQITVVPEPGTIVMLLGVLVGLVVLGWRRR